MWGWVLGKIPFHENKASCIQMYLICQIGPFNTDKKWNGVLNSTCHIHTTSLGHTMHHIIIERIPVFIPHHINILPFFLLGNWILNNLGDYFMSPDLDKSSNPHIQIKDWCSRSQISLKIFNLLGIAKPLGKFSWKPMTLWIKMLPI